MEVPRDTFLFFPFLPPELYSSTTTLSSFPRSLMYRYDFLDFHAGNYTAPGGPATPSDPASLACPTSPARTTCKIHADQDTSRGREDTHKACRTWFDRRDCRDTHHLHQRTWGLRQPDIPALPSSPSASLIKRPLLFCLSD